MLAETPGHVLAHLRGPRRQRATRACSSTRRSDPAFMTILLDSIGDRRRFKGRRGELRGVPDRDVQGRARRERRRCPPSPIGSEQSNSSVIFGDRIILKLYRALEHGINPDLEIGRFLTARGFGSVAARVRRARVRRRRRLTERGRDRPAVRRQPGRRVHAHPRSARRLHRTSARGRPAPGRRTTHGCRAAGRVDRGAAADRPPDRRLVPRPARASSAFRTGELHAALASETRDPAFAPEPFTEHYQRSRLPVDPHPVTPQPCGCSHGSPTACRPAPRTTRRWSSPVTPPWTPACAPC